jgi:hypothetical protein
MTELEQAIANLTIEQRCEIAVSAIFNKVNGTANRCGTAGQMVLNQMVANGDALAQLMSCTSASDVNGVELHVGDSVQVVATSAVYTIAAIRDFCQVLDLAPLEGGDTLSVAPAEVRLYARAGV